MGETGLAAAEGWNGDSFAVLEHKTNGDLLLLIYSSWDSQTEAQEFRDAYEKLLKLKYPGGNETIKIQSNTNEVLIIEGSSKNNIGSLLEFMKGVKKVKN